MHLRFERFGWRFYVALTRSYRMGGVNSRALVGDDILHFLMWDFDDVPQAEVIAALSLVQDWYGLGEIRVVHTGFSNYHAYCFDPHSWADTVAILTNTPWVDQAYLKIGYIRGYYTLRITPKKGREMKLIAVLGQRLPWEIDPTTVGSFSEYLTSKG